MHKKAGPRPSIHSPPFKHLLSVALHTDTSISQSCPAMKIVIIISNFFFFPFLSRLYLIFTQIHIDVNPTILKILLKMLILSFYGPNFHSDTHLRQCLYFNLILIILISKILPSFFLFFFFKKINLTIFSFYQALFHTKVTITYLLKRCYLSKALRNKPIYQLSTLMIGAQILINTFT